MEEVDLRQLEEDSPEGESTESTVASKNNEYSSSPKGARKPVLNQLPETNCWHISSSPSHE
jgi:hypothetical protein